MCLERGGAQCLFPSSFFSVTNRNVLYNNGNNGSQKGITEASLIYLNLVLSHKCDFCSVCVPLTVYHVHVSEFV